ncbi:ATP-binding protein [Paenibacillus elgii]|uniref:ATP-binding protein n=1 Tax=Paenibacillus elgii TaxID=189691 RepID=UPI0030D8E6D7
MLLGEENKRPFVPKKTHPIETGKYLIATKEVIRMYSEIKQWIENRAPGGIAYGRPRLGKTRAVRYIRNELPLDFGEGLPIFQLNCRQNNRPNENLFYEELLSDFGHALPYKGRVTMKSERLINFLKLKAEESGTRRVVIFVDDAQRLEDLHYNVLMDIHNKLDQDGITLTTILVGQPELEHRRSAFVHAKQAQIVGRFMVHEYKFSGIKSLIELETCLAGYDEVSEYPDDSGWSFTRYYFPDSFVPTKQGESLMETDETQKPKPKGFRLKNYAEEVYTLFDDLRKQAGIKKKLEIPMQYLALSVEYLFKKYGVDGKRIDYLNLEHWNEAIRRSGYLENEFYEDLF